MVLFGSTAKGQLRPDRDVDLGIILAPDNPSARQDTYVGLARATNREIDLVYIPDAPPQLAFEIAKGICLFERDKGAWRDMKYRAMLDWRDWQETANWMHQIYADRLRRQVEAQRGS